MSFKYFAGGAAALLLTTTSSFALTVSGVSNATGTSLISTLADSSISVVAGTESYTGADNQGGTYSDFGTVGVGALADGIVMSSGYADQVPLSNTDSSWDHENLGLAPPEFQPGGSSTEADTSALLTSKGLNSDVNDVNVLEFDFTVEAGKTSVSAEFVFGTDEFPDQSVTDIFAFFVDGVNYAEFDDGSLINFQAGANDANYNDNTGGTFAIEWDGVTDVLKVTGLLDQNLSTHNLKIVLADTSDNVFDSAVYITGLTAGSSSGGGIDPTSPVPLPAGLPLLLAGLGAFGVMRRTKKAS